MAVRRLCSRSLSAMLRGKPGFVAAISEFGSLPWSSAARWSRYQSCHHRRRRISASSSDMFVLVGLLNGFASPVNAHTLFASSIYRLYDKKRMNDCSVVKSSVVRKLASMSFCSVIDRYAVSAVLLGGLNVLWTASADMLAMLAKQMANRIASSPLVSRWGSCVALLIIASVLCLCTILTS